jgi:hypothetical protein
MLDFSTTTDSMSAMSCRYLLESQTNTTRLF